MALIEAYNSGENSHVHLRKSDGGWGFKYNPTENHSITSIKFKWFREGTIGSVDVKVYAGGGLNYLPTGDPLGGTTVDVSTITTNAAGEWITVSISVGTITSGEKYCITVEPVEADWGWGNYLSWLEVSPGEYTRAIYEILDSWNDVSYPWDSQLFEIWGELAGLSKPVNPTPTNDATEVDFSGFTLGWEDGGGANTYDVYIGPSGNLSLVSYDQVDISYVTNIGECPYNQKIYWRVDAVAGIEITTGDVWNFDARPAKPVNPTPSHEDTDIKLSWPTLTWEAG